MVKNMFPYIDTHAHLSMLDERGIAANTLLDSLFAGGFGAVVDIGTLSDDLPARLGRFGDYARVRFTAGIWPSREAIARKGEAIRELEAAIDAAPEGAVVAVGECGIDRHWNVADRGADVEGERILFEEQARLALRKDLPLVVHSREAAAETAEALAAVDGVRGIIHCYSYGAEEARRFLDLGFYLSFSGTVTYRNAQDQQAAARYVGADRLLVETDSPYLAPVPHRGKAAHPGMVEYAYRAIAELRGIREERLVEIVGENARRLFGAALP